MSYNYILGDTLLSYDQCNKYPSQLFSMVEPSYFSVLSVVWRPHRRRPSPWAIGWSTAAPGPEVRRRCGVSLPPQTMSKRHFLKQNMVGLLKAEKSTISRPQHSLAPRRRPFVRSQAPPAARLRSLPHRSPRWVGPAPVRPPAPLPGVPPMGLPARTPAGPPHRSPPSGLTTHGGETADGPQQVPHSSQFLKVFFSSPAPGAWDVWLVV